MDYLPTSFDMKPKHFVTKDDNNEMVDVVNTAVGENQEKELGEIEDTSSSSSHKITSASDIMLKPIEIVNK